MFKLIRIAGLLGLLVCSIGAISADKLNITLYPRIIQAGGSTWLTCHVPRHPDNRKLIFGITDFRDNSERDLEGERSMVTWKTLMTHVPCEAGDAYCIVVKSDGSRERVVSNLVISGCEENAEDPFGR